jgi:hypothetical protein
MSLFSFQHRVTSDSQLRIGLLADEFALPKLFLLPNELYDPYDLTLPADEYGPRLDPFCITFFYDVSFFALA